MELLSWGVLDPGGSATRSAQVQGTEPAWLHIGSDLALFLAFLVLPALVLWFVTQRRTLSHQCLFWLAILFSASCSLVWAVDVLFFWYPVYWVAALARFSSAVLSWAVVLSFASFLPALLQLRSPSELEDEILRTTAELSQRVYQVQMLAAIVRHSRDAQILVDPLGRISAWNHAAEELFGVSSGEAVGRRFTEVLSVPEIERGLERTRAGAAVCTRALELRGRVGEITYTPIGELGISVVFHDQTERHRAQQALISSETRFRATFEQAAVGIAHVGTDGGWLKVNQRLCELLGYEEHELRGMTFQDLTHPDDLDADLSLLEQVLEGSRQTYSMEKRYLHRDGGIVWAELTVSFVRSAEIPYFVSVVQDVSERKAAERLLEKQSRALQQSNQDLRQFAHSVSHDLRAPLRAIESFARMLDRQLSPLPDKAQHRLGRIQTNARAMDEMIRGMLRFSEVGQASLQRSRLDLEGMVWDAVEICRSAHPDEVFDVVVGELAPMDADATLMRQVIANLVGNAFKYAREGRAPHLRVSCEVVDGAHTYTFADSGPGFPEQKAEQIFQPFVRAHGAEVAGSGIGLAITRRIVERHGGTVRATSPPGQGACFFLEFPLSSS